MEPNLDVHAGDIVYVFYDNPQSQNSTSIVAAAVVNHPESEDELALFLYDNYYPISNEFPIYQTREAAQHALNYYHQEISEGTIQ